MKLLKILGLFVVVAGVGVVMFAAVPLVHGQKRPTTGERRTDSMLLSGPGSTIGVSIRDLETSEAERQKVQTGVVVDSVRPDSPAGKAGLERSDIIVEFDGEHVRSARQFSRLVQETPPGRPVKATIVRDGQKKDLQITPSAGRALDFMIDADRLRELAERLPLFDFDAGIASRSRLGVTVQEMTPQLAEYFGAKEGVLIAGVADDSPAARAGLKVGDVITSIEGRAVRSRSDLVRELRNRGDGEVTIGIVREKKETTVKATIEPTRRTFRSTRPV